MLEVYSSTKVTVVDANKFNSIYRKDTIHLHLIMYLHDENQKERNPMTDEKDIFKPIKKHKRLLMGDARR